MVTGPSRAIYLRSCNAPLALALCSILSVHTAARELFSMNYPERGRMRSALVGVGGVGDEEPPWRCCSWSKGGEARCTRPGHFSRNLSSAQDDVVELPRGQKLPDRRQDGTALSVA
jgi:hypothetical protein